MSEKKSEKKSEKPAEKPADAPKSAPAAALAPAPIPAASATPADRPPVAPAARSVDAPERFDRPDLDANRRRGGGDARDPRRAPAADPAEEYRAAYQDLAGRDPEAAAKYPNPRSPGLNYDVSAVLEQIRKESGGLRGVAPQEIKS